MQLKETTIVTTIHNMTKRSLDANVPSYEILKSQQSE